MPIEKPTGGDPVVYLSATRVTAVKRAQYSLKESEMAAHIHGPNSLRSILVDSLLMATLSALALIALAGVTRSAEMDAESSDEIASRETDRMAPEAAAERASRDDPIDSELNSDDSMVSEDTPEYAAAKAEAIVLGMKLKVEDQTIRVKDVGATTPAWDAGIRKGDKLISLNNLKPKVFDEWVKDLNRILADTPDGQSVPVVIERDNEQLELRVRLPISHADAARDRRQELEQQEELARQYRQMQMSQPVEGAVLQQGRTPASNYGPGYGGYGYDGGSVAVFDDDGQPARGDGRLAGSAMARLFATSKVGTSAGRANNADFDNAQQNAFQNSQATGNQIGTATFQSNGLGVVANVEVNGLPPGNYLVGISQDSGMRGLGVGGVNEQLPPADVRRSSGTRNPRARSNSDATPVPIVPDAQRQPVQRNPATPRRGAGGASGGASPAFEPHGASGDAGAAAPIRMQTAKYILAQRIDPQIPANGSPGAVGGQVTPRGGQAAVPGTQMDQGMNERSGAVHDPRATDTGQVPRELRRQNSRNSQSSLPGAGYGTGGGGQFIAQIGSLQVGQNGSGQVQQQLEGLEVRNLAGLSVIVVSTSGPRGAAQVGSGFGTAQSSATNPRVSQQAAARTAQQGRRPATTDQHTSGFANHGLMNQGVVASGVIQVAGDSGQNSATDPAQAQAVGPTDAQIRQREQRRQFDATPPAETFDPLQQPPQ